MSDLIDKILEDITLDIDKGDTVLTGRFKNHKVVVKDIDKDEHGMPTVNGKGITKIRIPKNDKFRKESIDIIKNIKRNKEKIYTFLLSVADSGPFDGGCVIAAYAIKMAIGGEVFVLVSTDDFAEHAVVKLGNKLYDFDGGLPENEFIRRFNVNEMSNCVAVRPIRKGDLPAAPVNMKASKIIKELIV